MKLCDYGCGQEAIYKFKNGKYCCSISHNSCPHMKKLNSIKTKGKNKGKIRSLEVRQKMSKSKIGLQTGEKSPTWKGGYNLKNIPTYKQYASQLFPMEKVKRNEYDNNILDVACAYCGRYYTPKLHSIIDRIRSINSVGFGDHRLYCSDRCKKECPIYKQQYYQKDFKIATSREVQAELRQMRFEIDGHVCQKCGKHQSELDVGLHCHHIEGVRWEPLESADVDKVITLCKNCHLEVHKIEGCGYHDLRCKP